MLYTSTTFYKFPYFINLQNKCQNNNCQTHKDQIFYKTFPLYLLHITEKESVLLEMMHQQKVHLDMILAEKSSLFLFHKTQFLNKEKNMKWVSNCS